MDRILPNAKNKISRQALDSRSSIMNREYACAPLVVLLGKVATSLNEPKIDNIVQSLPVP